MNKDRRRSERYKVKDIKGALTFAIEVKIVNISVKGISVESKKPLNINKTYLIKIPLERNKKLELEGEVVWSTLVRLEKTPEGDVVPIYRAGLKFKNTLSDKAEEIINFIEKHKVSTIEQRIFGRFEILSDNVKVYHPQELKVETLSSEGMLIEISEELKKDEIYEMSIITPDNQQIRFKGRVTSVSKIENRDSYKIGIEFISMNKSDKERLKRLLDKLH
jgi:c-di-GMP-binding flagellar brake protein YcgR